MTTIVPRRKHMSRLSLPFVLLACLCRPCAAGIADDGMEVLKTDFQTHSLHCLDMDGDGRDDIVLANRDRGSIDILYARTGAEEAPRGDPDRNQVHFNSRWRLVSVPVDRDIQACAVTDLDGDGRPDVVYHGAPAGLVVLKQEAGGSPFGSPREIELPAGLPDPNSLLVRALSGGNTEVAVQHDDRRTHLLLGPDGGLLEKVEVAAPRATLGQFRLMQWGRLAQGDAGLWVHQKDAAAPLLFYRQLGPLRYDHPERVRLPQTRFLVSGRFQEGETESFVQVRTQLGQLSLVSMETGAPETRGKPFPFSPRTIPYASTGSKGFAFLQHDVDGDGAEDLLVAHRESAQIELFLKKGATFQPGRLFPCYKDADFLLPAAGGVLVASRQEGMIGLSAWDGERLLFPAARPAEGETVAFLAVHGQADGCARVLKVDGKPVLALGADRFGLKLEEPFPRQGLVVNLRGGARPELLLEIPYQGLRLFGWDTAENAYTNLVSRLSFLKDQDLAEATLGGVDLLPAGNACDLSLSGPRLIRRYRFAGAPQVVEQVNLPDPGSVSTLHRFMDLDRDGTPELVSYDGPAGRLDIFAREAPGKPFRWVRSQPAPPAKGLRLMSVDGGGAAGRDLLLAGLGEMEWFRADGAGAITAKPKAIPFRDEDWAFSFDGIALPRSPKGPDTLFLFDGKQHYLEMLSCRDGKWRRDCSYPVFSTGSFQNNKAAGEVREIVVAGPADRRRLLFLVHDRILVHDWRSGI